MTPSDITLREALRRHLAENGFPPDGGLSEKWGVVRVGPVPLCIPNTKARRRATPIHDLNHVVSGCGHDAIGESEIGAFELGGGCKTYSAAWIFNFAALGIGIWISPRRVFAAFVRGRRTGNLYGTDVAALLDQPLDRVRTTLGLDSEYVGNLGDVVRFVGFVVLAPLFGLIPTAASIILTSPVWFTQGAHRQHRTVAEL